RRSEEGQCAETRRPVEQCSPSREVNVGVDETYRIGAERMTAPCQGPRRVQPVALELWDVGQLIAQVQWKRPPADRDDADVEAEGKRRDPGPPLAHGGRCTARSDECATDSDPRLSVAGPTSDLLRPSDVEATRREEHGRSYPRCGRTVPLARRPP